MAQKEKNQAVKTPLYQVIKLELEQRILNGELAAGELLPTEYELCKHYQVSRITIRAALDRLEREGWISRLQGRGSRVLQRSSTLSTSEVLGYTRATALKGQTPRKVVIGEKLMSGDAKLLELFGFPQDSGQQFWVFHRLDYFEGSPAVAALHYIPKDMGDQMRKHDLNDRSFYALFEQIHGQPIHSSKMLLSAVAANEENARLLKVAVGSPLIWYHAVNSFLDGTVAELDISVFRPDRFMFETELYRNSSRRILTTISEAGPYQVP